LQSRLIFLTGRPGVGKTTVFLRTVDDLRGRGVIVGGMSTAEIRREGARIGFEVKDLSSGKSGVLAHVSLSSGPRVGKYRVNLRDLEEIGVMAIVEALRKMEVVAIDEVAPMELSSNSFVEALMMAVESGKPLLGTLHFRAGGKAVSMIRNNPSIEIIEVTLGNREDLHRGVSAKVLRLLRSV